jgi:hypothetical protein
LVFNLDRRVATLALLALGACRGDKPPKRRDAAPAAAAVDARTAPWPALADLPVVRAIAVIELPVASRVPPASIVGPLVVGDLAVIGSSQIGFAAIDWRGGTVAWRRTTGPHLAPPLAHADGVLLVGECERAPLAPADQIVVGCWLVVSPTGSVVGAGPIVGDADPVAAFVAARGETSLIPLAEHRMRWSRGDAAIVIDLDTGRAVPTSVVPLAAIARHKRREWRIAIEPDEALVARDPAGVEQWRMTTRFAAVIGILPGQAHEVPMVRVVNLKGASGHGFVDLIDIDATGSRLGQAGALVPGIQIIGHAFAPTPGDTVLAVRLDTTLQHDYLAAHDGRGGLAWVWPLPERARPDPVGLAFADDGSVIAFHDGDRVSVLPAVSRRSTRSLSHPGSGPEPSGNPTP